MSTTTKPSEAALKAATKHTPGPWRVAGGNEIRTVRGDDVVLLADAGTSRILPMDEMLANAALMARAPDLFAENETLRAALAKCERIDALRDELSECCARVNGAGRTTSAESAMTSKKRIAEIRAEIKDAKEAARAALGPKGGA